MIAAGRKDGVDVDDPVVTQDGLVGTVSRVGSRTARVTLLTDDQSAVSAIDVATRRVRHRPARAGPRAPLRLDRVPQGGASPRRRHGRHRRLAVAAPLLDLPTGHPDRARHERRADRHRSLHPGAGRRRSPTSASLEAVLVLLPRERGERVSVALRVAPLVFVAAVVQVATIGGLRLLGAEPDLLLVTVVALALVRGLARRRRRGLRGRAARRRDDARDARGDLDPPDPRGLLGGALRRDDRRAAAPTRRPSPRSRSRSLAGVGGHRAPLPARPVGLGAHGARRRVVPSAILAAALVVAGPPLCASLLDAVVRASSARGRWSSL